jgi:hypothetical protein
MLMNRLLLNNVVWSLLFQDVAKDLTLGVVAFEAAVGVHEFPEGLMGPFLSKKKSMVVKYTQ